MKNRKKIKSMKWQKNAITQKQHIFKKTKYC